MIELTEVSRWYGRKGAGTPALADVSLSLQRGTVTAVVGPNGAGKSTLLSLLLGFIRPSAGTIEIAGEPPRDYLREHGAGYLPERFSLPGAWRTGDALRMLARLDGAAGVAEGALETLGLAPHADRRVRELSRGLLQRLGLAQALLARRDLVVLDEPTEGLDPVWRVRLRDIVSGLGADGRTVIIASHDLGEVERIADRAIVLDGGAVRDVLDVRERAAAASYRIRLAAPFEEVPIAFPGAERAGELEQIVTVASAAELSQRLAALIALGAVIAAVEPIRPDLEARVRDALEHDA